MRSTPQALLSRVRNPQDHQAWQEFDALYRELLISFARRRGIPHIDAEDLVQGVFIGLTHSLPQFVYDPNRGRFRDYLYRCMRNAISDWASRPNRRLEAVLPDSAVASARQTETIRAVAPALNDGNGNGELVHIWEEEWVAHHYRRAMAVIRETFDDKSAAVFDRSIAGASVTDLSAEFGLSEQAVYKIRQRIRARMEELIARQVRDEDAVDDPPAC